MAISDIRFRRLGYLALNVSDPDKSRNFFVDMVGMQDCTPNASDRIFLRCSDKHHDLMLLKGPAPGLKRVGWEMESKKAYDAVRDHMRDIGLPLYEVAHAESEILGIGEAFRVSEPTSGATFEFFFEFERSREPFAPTHTNIMRLGHVVINSADRDATERFMMENLNFRVSDRVDGMVTFMRAFPNPLHHSLGVSAGTLSGLNHVNFMVTDMDDIGRAANRAKATGVPIVYGIGKHPPSESVFLYYLCPDGMTFEYSYGMEEFPEHAPRAPRLMPARLESVDYWGGVPDPRAGKTGALEGLGGS